MNKFQRLFSYIEKMRTRYLNILSAHKVWDTISTLSAPNKVGKDKDKAKENIEVFNRYRYFFVTTKEACRVYLLIEVIKFFDNDNRNQSLTLDKIINFTESNLEELTKKDFLSYHKGRKMIKELFDSQYKEFSKSDLDNLRRKIQSKREIIDRLKKYRDKSLAHDDITKKEIKISISEIVQLMDLIKEFIDVFYSKLDFATNSYKNYIEEPEEEIKFLVNILKESEELRLEKIHTKYSVN